MWWSSAFSSGMRSGISCDSAAFTISSLVVSAIGFAGAGFKCCFFLFLSYNRSVHYMNFDVRFEIAAFGELFAAAVAGTHIGAFPSVRPEVDFQRARPEERTAARLAPVRTSA